MLHQIQQIIQKADGPRAEKKLLLGQLMWLLKVCALPAAEQRVKQVWEGSWMAFSAALPLADSGGWPCQGGRKTKEAACHLLLSARCGRRYLSHIDFPHTCACWMWVREQHSSRQREGCNNLSLSSKRKHSCFSLKKHPNNSLVYSSFCGK